MRKKLIISIIFCFLIFGALIIESKAFSLTNFNATLNKTTYLPGEDIIINFYFGDNLGEYEFSIAYDKNLMDFIETDGGEVGDTSGDIITISYEDLSHGTNPKNGFYVKFKAKENIITTNPTNFLINGTNFKTANFTENIDSFQEPIKEEFLIEPIYEEYNINFDFSGEVIKNVEKDVKLEITSGLGKPYDHARIEVEVSGENTQGAMLFGYDENGNKYDLIQDGFGNKDGYMLGGKDIRKTLELKMLFPNSGEYNVNVKIVDKENSDVIISQNLFYVTVKNFEGEEIALNSRTKSENTVNTSSTNEISSNTNDTKNDTKTENTVENTKTSLIKTGSNGYIGVSVIAILFVFGYLYLEHKRNK